MTYLLLSILGKIFMEESKFNFINFRSFKSVLVQLNNFFSTFRTKLSNRLIVKFYYRTFLMNFYLSLIMNPLLNGSHSTILSACSDSFSKLYLFIKSNSFVINIESSFFTFGIINPPYIKFLTIENQTQIL